MKELPGNQMLSKTFPRPRPLSFPQHAGEGPATAEAFLDKPKAHHEGAATLE